MIQPAVGRSVWYYPAGASTQDQPQAAIITRIITPSVVDLAIFAPTGAPMAKPPVNIPLIQPGVEPPVAGNFCTFTAHEIAVSAALAAAPK